MPMRGFFIWMILLLLFYTVYQFLTQGETRQNVIPFSPDFTRLVEQDKVQKLTIVSEVSGSQFIRGEATELDPETGQPKKFRTNVIVTEDTLTWLREKDIPFQFETQSPYLMQFLTGAVPFLLVLGLLYFLFARQMRMMGRGAMSFGKSRAKLLSRDRNKITFDNVAGVDEATEEVQEIVEFLKDPKKFQKLGGRIPKGVLLIGPPGTGKTLLAKAIAGEAEVPFFSISGSDFVEMFVGVGASRVRDMFEQGKKNAPCIIFIDEIDAVGRSRFSGIGGGHDEREQTLNALLVEMDGFETQEGVIILAATNRPDVLDNALLRPGRFDRQIYVDLPSLDGREKILRIHSKDLPVADVEDLRIVARGTPGFSGADLANLVNEAALLAARRGVDRIERHDFEEARDKVRWGRERRSRMMDDTEKRLTAYHEAGHALVMQLIEECDPLHKVTIIPRGQALGATMQLPEKDQYTQGKKKLLGIITGMMGGRAAEEAAFEDVTTGGQNDFMQATRIARKMVCDWGMSPLGPIHYGPNEEVLFLGREVSRQQEYSEETARRIDAEVSQIIETCHSRAMGILRDHREKLDLIAEALLERETLDGEDIADAVNLGVLRVEDKKHRAAPPTVHAAEGVPEPGPVAPEQLDEAAEPASS